MQQPVRHDEGPGIYEWVLGSSVVAFKFAYGSISGVCGTPTDLCPDTGIPLEQGAEGEQLGYALNREWLVAVSLCHNLAIDHGNNHAEFLSGDQTECRNLA